MPLAHYRFISEHYFETMGVALRQGRFPTSHDHSRKIALVSESAAAEGLAGRESNRKADPERPQTRMG